MMHRISRGRNKSEIGVLDDRREVEDRLSLRVGLTLLGWFDGRTRIVSVVKI